MFFFFSSLFLYVSALLLQCLLLFASVFVHLLFVLCVGLLCTLAPLQVFLLPFLSLSVFVCLLHLSLFASALLSGCLPPNLCLSVSTCCCGGTPPFAATCLLNTAVLFLAWMESCCAHHLPDGSSLCLSTYGGLQLPPLFSPLLTWQLPPRLLCCMGPLDKPRLQP